MAVSNGVMTVNSGDLLDSRISGRVAARLSSRTQRPTGTWSARIASWLALVDLCLEVDDALNITEEEPPAVLALHRAVLSLGIGTGEWLLQQIQANSVNLSTSGDNFDSLAASLKLLEICFNTRHGGTPEAEIAEIQRRIFNAAA